MKVKHLVAALSAGIVILFGSSAMAMGVGYTMYYGVGKNYWLKAATKNATSRIGDAGLGLTIDTNLARDELLNYRMDLHIGIGYEMHKTFDDLLQYHNAPYMALSTVHTLGFGVYRSQTLRLWLGPQISLGGMYGTPAGYGAFSHNKNTWGFNGGLGAAMGLNVNIGKVFTLAFSAAVRGEGAYKNHSYQKYTVYDAIWMYSTPLYLPVLLYPDKQREDSGIRVYGQFNLAFLFRIDDAYGVAHN